MKQVLLLLAFFICTDLQAQTRPSNPKKPRKKAHTARLTSRPQETYTSSGGKIKARSLGKYEQPDTVDNLHQEAPHINSNFNESMPPLSPSNGSSSPR